MEFYATVKSNNSVGTWIKLNASNVTIAKRKATARFGGGYLGHEIHLVESTDSEQLNDLPAYIKVVGSREWKYKG